MRVREGVRTVTDGPYSETKEQLGGYFLIDVETLEEAIEIAAESPVRTAAPQKFAHSWKFRGCQKIKSRMGGML